MRLSDAIMMGSMLCRMKMCDINACAIGVAATAVGIRKSNPSRSNERYDSISIQWPWLASNHNERMWEITELFDNKVSTSQMTIEQLVDHVRSIEPSCGECCSFDCCCERGARVEAEFLAQGVLSEARV